MAGLPSALRRLGLWLNEKVTSEPGMSQTTVRSEVAPVWLVPELVGWPVQITGKRPTQASAQRGGLRGFALIQSGRDTLEVPGQQLSGTVDRVIGDALDDMAQVGFGIEPVHLGRFD
jgi:hypothetical protein